MEAADSSWLLASAWLAAPLVALGAAVRISQLYGARSEPSSSCDAAVCCKSSSSQQQTSCGCSKPMKVTPASPAAVRVLYASTTGTSRAFAEELALAVKSAGYPGDVQCSNVADSWLEDPDTALGNLPQGSILLLVLSTWQVCTV